MTTGCDCIKSQRVHVAIKCVHVYVYMYMLRAYSNVMETALGRQHM